MVVLLMVNAKLMMIVNLVGVVQKSVEVKLKVLFYQPVKVTMNQLQKCLITNVHV